jgi:hypothetical protein
MELVVACFQLTCEYYSTAKKKSTDVVRISGLRGPKFHTPTYADHTGRALPEICLNFKVAI